MPAQDLNTTPQGGALRMMGCLVTGVALLLAAAFWDLVLPGNPVARLLFSASLLAMGGWGGYWLDRALFPYDRPHLYLLDDGDELDPDDGLDAAALGGDSTLQVCAGASFSYAMLRRAIVVAACLLCLGLAA